MLLTTHALVGAALGKNISNPWLIVLFAIPLHFLLDHFRHGEYLDRNSRIKNTWWKIALDIFCGSAIIASCIFFLHPTHEVARNILIGTLFSMLPDLLTLLYWKFHLTFLKKVFVFHAWCHKYPPFAEERNWTIRNARNDFLFSLIATMIIIFF